MPVQCGTNMGSSSLDAVRLRQDIHSIFTRWHKAEVEPAMEYLTIVESVQGSEFTGEQKPIHAVIQAALTELEATSDEYAQVLRLRFLDQKSLVEVAERMNMAVPSVSRKQKKALDELIDIITEQELCRRAARRLRFYERLGPEPYTKLFGAEYHINNLTQLLSSRQHPWLIAIEGIGGIGKTVLADSLMRRAINQDLFANYGWTSVQPYQLNMRGKITSVSTEPAQTTDEVLLALAEQLLHDLPLSIPEQVMPVLQEQLKSSPHLIVVDNLETFQDRDSLLPRLRELANPAVFIFTARERILDVPNVYPYRIGELSTTDALKLIRFEAASNNLPLVAASSDEQLLPIVETVGGNPLALKLVVGQLHVCSLHVLVEALQQAQGDSIENLYTFIYRSAWERLDEGSQTVLLATLLLPPQGEDFEFLRHTTSLDTAILINALNKLVDLNLVNRHYRDSLDENRYTIHSLTRTFLTTQILKKWRQE